MVANILKMKYRMLVKVRFPSVYEQVANLERIWVHSSLQPGVISNTFPLVRVKYASTLYRQSSESERRERGCVSKLTNFAINRILSVYFFFSYLSQVSLC